jgi:hypothetical protein
LRWPMVRSSSAAHASAATAALLLPRLPLTLPS